MAAINLPHSYCAVARVRDGATAVRAYGYVTDRVQPGIVRLSKGGVSLRPCRVDLSQTGDSILTDIIDGMRIRQLFLADVSVIGRDESTGDVYRNANVLYEVGLSLASRQPGEVLLIREDPQRFLFDVNTIPHLAFDFTAHGDQARPDSKKRTN